MAHGRDHLSVFGSKLNSPNVQWTIFVGLSDPLGVLWPNHGFGLGKGKKKSFFVDKGPGGVLKSG